jgi:CheY-like chemotaxis protein
MLGRLFNVLTSFFDSCALKNECLALADTVLIVEGGARMSEPSLPKAALLCIDDDRTVLECEKVFLETFGYTVVTASSGPEGLKLAGLHSFDVVIVDYCMPEMNGQEFAIAMRRLKPLAPIIMLSAAVDVPEQALKVVDAFVAKDCLTSQLLPTIARSCVFEPLPSSSYDA